MVQNLYMLQFVQVNLYKLQLVQNLNVYITYIYINCRAINCLYILRKYGENEVPEKNCNMTLIKEVSLLWICVNFSVFRTVLQELWPTPPSIHTSLLLELYYNGCRLSTALSLRLPCLYISFYTGVTPNIFEPFLIPRHSAYNTRPSQSDGMFLEVSLFASVFKSRKYFGLSFVYDAPMIRTTSLKWSALQIHLPPSGQG